MVRPIGALVKVFSQFFYNKSRYLGDFINFLSGTFFGENAVYQTAETCVDVFQVRFYRGQNPDQDFTPVVRVADPAQNPQTDQLVHCRGYR